MSQQLQEKLERIANLDFSEIFIPAGRRVGCTLQRKSQRTSALEALDGRGVQEKPEPLWIQRKTLRRAVCILNTPAVARDAKQKNNACIAAVRKHIALAFAPRNC